MEGERPFVILNTAMTADGKIDTVARRGAVISSAYDLEGVDRLLVEGGGTLNAELLGRGLVDEIYLYLAPLIFGGAEAPTLAGGAGLEREEAIRLQLLGLEKMDDGAILLHYALPHD